MLSYCTSGKSGSQYSALISVISGAPKTSPESNTYASILRNIDGILERFKSNLKILKRDFSGDS